MLDATYYLSADGLADFCGMFVPFVGWGLGLGACFWMMGHVLWFIVDCLRF